MRRIREWYRLRKLGESGYVLLVAFQYTKSYMDKGYDAMFIYTKIHRALDRHYGKEAIDTICTSTYRLCKAGVTEKEYIRFLKKLRI